MFGKNKIQKPESGDGKTLKVTEIFPTFQGEGPFTGHPAVFIRLSGCNLACDFCDTEFDKFEEFSIEEIVSKATFLSNNQDGKRTKNLIVLTGGETLRQPIEALCQKLLLENFQVQIETNGTIFRDIDDRIDIICSPKAQNGKYFPVRPDLLPKINAFKFIISAEKEGYQDITEVGQSEYNTPIYLQPMDEYNEEKNNNNIKATLQLAEKYGARISLQTHKILGIE